MNKSVSWRHYVCVKTFSFTVGDIFYVATVCPIVGKHCLPFNLSLDVETLNMSSA